jgi:3-methylfumaryl-CoA hydratase
VLSPVFDITPFSVCGWPDVDGKAAALWAETGDGALAMEARATFAQQTKVVGIVALSFPIPV